MIPGGEWLVLVAASHAIGGFLLARFRGESFGEDLVLGVVAAAVLFGSVGGMVVAVDRGLPVVAAYGGGIAAGTVLAAVLGVVFLGDRIDRRGILGLGLVLAGVVGLLV